MIMKIQASRSLRPTTTTVPAIRQAPPLVGEVEAHAMRDAPIRMLRIDQVLAVTGLSKTRFYVMQAQGHFPLRVQLSPRRVGWVEADVQAWLAARIASSKPLAER
jgi:prophage regulatory protein